MDPGAGGGGGDPFSVAVFHRQRRGKHGNGAGVIRAGQALDVDVQVGGADFKGRPVEVVQRRGQDHAVAGDQREVVLQEFLEFVPGRVPVVPVGLGDGGVGVAQDVVGGGVVAGADGDFGAGRGGGPQGQRRLRRDAGGRGVGPLVEGEGAPLVGLRGAAGRPLLHVEGGGGAVGRGLVVVDEVDLPAGAGGGRTRAHAGPGDGDHVLPGGAGGPADVPPERQGVLGLVERAEVGHLAGVGDAAGGVVGVELREEAEAPSLGRLYPDGIVVAERRLGAVLDEVGGRVNDQEGQVEGGGVVGRQHLDVGAAAVQPAVAEPGRAGGIPAGGQGGVLDDRHHRRRAGRPAQVQGRQFGGAGRGQGERGQQRQEQTRREHQGQVIWETHSFFFRVRRERRGGSSRMRPLPLFHRFGGFARNSYWKNSRKRGDGRRSFPLRRRAAGDASRCFGSFPADTGRFAGNIGTDDV